MGKVKRKKKDDGDEEITYINERNKVFNKKVSRRVCRIADGQLTRIRLRGISTSIRRSTSLLSCH
jgi:hypothetical protein